MASRHEAGITKLAAVKVKKGCRNNLLHFLRGLLQRFFELFFSFEVRLKVAQDTLKLQ